MNTNLMFNTFVLPSSQTSFLPQPSQSRAAEAWSKEDLQNLTRKIQEKALKILRNCQFQKNTEHQKTSLTDTVTLKRAQADKEEVFRFFLSPPCIQDEKSEHCADLIVLNSKPYFSGGSKAAYEMLEAYRCTHKVNQYGLEVVDLNVKSFVKSTKIFLVNRKDVGDKFINEHERFKRMSPDYAVQSFGTLKDPVQKTDILIQENGGNDLGLYLQNAKLSEEQGLSMALNIVDLLLSMESYKWAFLDVKHHNLTINEFDLIKVIDSGAWIEVKDSSLILNDGFTPPYVDPSIVCAKFLFQRKYEGETPETKSKLKCMDYKQNPSLPESSEEELKKTQSYLTQNFKVKHISKETLNVWAAAILTLPILGKIEKLKPHFSQDPFNFPWATALSNFNIRLNPGIYKNSQKYQTLLKTSIPDLLTNMKSKLNLLGYCSILPDSKYARLIYLLEMCITMDLENRPKLEDIQKELQNLNGIKQASSVQQVLFQNDSEDDDLKKDHKKLKAEKE